MRSITIAFVLALSVTSVHDATARGAAPSATQAGATPSRSGPSRAIGARATSPKQPRSPRGFATYYAKMLDGRRTASGIPFDNDDMVAAHPHYPFGTVVRVTNLRNGRAVEVRIVDRGPARQVRASGVIIDLSRAAAQKLGFITAGRTRVRLDVLELPEQEEKS
jgi:rare lipoprotein A